MTRGARIARLSARWLHADTFELVVSPAIADLQFEAIKVNASRWTLVRAYVGVWRAFGGAVSWDVVRALYSALSADHRYSVAAAAGLFAGYVAAFVLFATDIAAGAQRLSRSAVISNPALRWPSLGAIAVLLFVSVAFFIAKAWDRQRGPIQKGGSTSRTLSTLCLFLGSLAIAGADARAAQADAPRTRIVSQDGVAMRISTAGIEQRRPEQPVVILEAGAGEPGTFPLDTWRAVFPAIARIAPVFAYERRGSGMSDTDTETPTMRRVARVLHALLQQTRIGPPYLLVGQSWGGVYIRAFYDQYPDEVVGMVFVDAETGMGPTREEKAAVLPADERAAALAPPVLPPIPPNMPPGLRAEFEEIGKEMVNDGAESRTLRRVSGIPIALVMATPPGRMRGNSGAITRLMMRHASEWLLTSPNGIFVAANHVGHHVHVDDPSLVAGLVKHVLDHVGVPARDQRAAEPRR